ncbi:MAG: hypothetical protein ACYTGC_10090 [Planctomycetota bacterium]|jgi:hypothetical protein
MAPGSPPICHNGRLLLRAGGLGAATAARERLNAPIERVDEAPYGACADMIRSALDEASFERAVARGKGIAIEEAARMALEEPA